jgi:NitT/TauT family transport system substrate-binding protein
MTDPRSPVRIAPLTRRACLAAGAAVLLSAAAGCGDRADKAGQAGRAGSGTGGGLTTLRLTNTKYGGELLPVTAGLKRGVFAQHGIDLKVTNAKSSEVATSALVSGRQDLGLMQAAFVVSADAAGADLVMVGSLMDELDYHIITAKDVTSLEQLAGKKMGDPGPNNGNTATMKAVMDKAGIGADKLTYVTVGAQAAILAALQANQVQVGLLVAPFTIKARAAGLNDLGTVDKYLPHMTAAVIAGVDKTLRAKADLVRDFLAALVESTRWCAQHADEAIKILMEAENMSPGDAEESYREVADIYAKDGSIDPAGLQTWIDVAVKYSVMNKAVKVSDVYTDEYLAKG